MQGISRAAQFHSDSIGPHEWVLGNANPMNSTNVFRSCRLNIDRKIGFFPSLIQQNGTFCFIACSLLFLLTTESVCGQTINVGSESDLNNAIQTINLNSTNSYTLNFTSGFSLNQPVTEIASKSTVTLAGNSVTIDGANLFQPLILDSGTVTVQNLNVINAGLPVTLKSGVLIDATGSLRGPILNNGDLQFKQPSAETYAGAISGSGGVEILGSGQMTFSGANTYQGGTFIAFGSTLTGTTTSLQGTVIDYGTLQFQQSTAGTFSGVIAGPGNVQISGTGPITLTGLNSYVGGTYVDAGSSLIGTTSNFQGPIINSGLVQFHQSVNGTYSGNLVGTGRFEFGGGATYTLSGSNSYSGGTLLESGSQLIGSTTSLQGAMTNNGAITFNQTTPGTYSGNMTGSGSVKISGGSAITFTGLNHYTGGTTIDSGNTLLGTANSLQGGILNNGAVIFIPGGNGTYSGNMTGSGSVEISTNAAVTFSGSNTYSGGTTIESNGTLITGTLGVLGPIVNNGTLKMNSSPGSPAFVPGLANPLEGANFLPSLFAGNITGTGKLEIGGGGITRLTGTNSYSGGTIVNSGSTLTGATTSLQGNFLNNGFVQFNTGSDTTNHQAPNSTSTVSGVFQSFVQYAGSMSGTGGVEISGGLPLLMSGNNTYTGGTYIDHGSALIGSTNALQGQIINNGVADFHQTFAGTYAGNMSGIGSVIVENALPVTFTGINTYSGGTTITSGSTLIGDTRSLQGAITNDGSLRFDQSIVGTYAGEISGRGSVDVVGLGTTTFSGANTYAGGTTIGNSGTLAVTGSILGNVSVNNGGTLMGTGTVGATTVNAGGTVAPGTIGSPLTIHGNFVQGAGSTYTAEISPTGSDKIVVEGTTQIGSATKLNLNIDPGTLTVGKHYELLSATGGLTGQYANVSTPPLTQNIVFSEHYGTNNLVLTVNSHFSPYALTPNQKAIASIFDQTSGSATGDYANAITQLTTLGSRPLAAALNQLSGSIYANIGTIERQTTTAQLQLVSNRLAGLSFPASFSPSVAQRTNGIRLVSRQASDEQPSNAVTNDPRISGSWTTWAQGYGLGGSVDGDSNVGGSNYRLGGTLFGVERWLTEDLLVGVLGGYAGTSISNRQDSSQAQLSAFQVGLYELYRRDSFYISNIDAYSNGSYDVTRPLDVGSIHSTASGSTSSNQWAHYTEGGLTYEIDEFRLQPFLGVQYMYLNQQGLTESGAGSLDLTTGQQIINSVRNSVGARIYHEAMWGRTLVIPALSARYQHEWGNGTQLVSSSFSGAPTLQFMSAGNRTGRDFGLFTLSATAFLTPHFNLFGALDTQVATNYTAVIGSGGIQYSW